MALYYTYKPYSIGVCKYPAYLFFELDDVKKTNRGMDGEIQYPKTP